MAYSPTNWQDGTTPIDATAMNKIESALTDQDERIDANTNLINGLGITNVMINGYSANTTYRFQFGEATTSTPSVGILYVRGNQGVQHLNLFVSGYGYSSSRVITVELSKGSAISYEVGDDQWYIDVTAASSSGGNLNVMGYLCIYGKVPSISAV